MIFPLIFFNYDVLKQNFKNANTVFETPFHDTSLCFGIELSFPKELEW